MARKTIAGKAALLAAIHHPGASTCTYDDPGAHQLVARFSSYIANVKNNNNDNGDYNADATDPDDIVVSEARRQINHTFTTVLNAERATSHYYQATLKSARRRGLISLPRYLAHRACLWAGNKVAESHISDIRGAHLRDVEEAVDSLRKNVFRENMLANEGFDPFGDQEDHMNTHYGNSCGSNIYYLNC